MRIVLLALAGLVLGAVAMPARAATMTYAGYSVLNAQVVHLTDAALGIIEQAGAGQVTLQGVNGGTGTVATFCIDIPDWLQPSGSFVTGSFVTEPFGRTVNALLSHVAPVLNAVANASAALQVAIWQAEYGTALTVSGNDDVVKLAASYLSNVATGVWTADPTMRVAALAGGGRTQDQAYLAPVAEPGTLLIVGAGLAGIAVIRRRRAPETPPPASVEHLE